MMMEPANAHLGIDLILGGDGELALSPSGDVAVTQDGRDALAQDICNLLETLPGDLFSHAEFGAGLGRLLGDTQQNHEERISRAVTDALAYHPSVASRWKVSAKPSSRSNLNRCRSVEAPNRRSTSCSAWEPRVSLCLPEFLFGVCSPASLQLARFALVPIGD
jgi:hypothetical protein